LLDWNLIATLSVMTGTLLATLYRIKIEKKQTQIQEENATYRLRIKMMKDIMKREKEEIKKMTPEEISEMLEEVFKEC
jgi:hypothetical protein